MVKFYHKDDTDKETRLTLIDAGDSINKYKDPDGTEVEYPHDQIREFESIMPKVFKGLPKVFSGTGAQDLAHEAALKRGDTFFVSIHKTWARHKLVSEDKWEYDFSYDFTSFKDRAAYLRFVKTIARFRPADRRHFFEQAVRKVKGFFDLDGGTPEQHREVVAHLITYYTEVLKLELTTDEIAILDGSRDGKVSTHLIINDRAYFETMADMKFIYSAFRAYVAAKSPGLEEIIDEIWSPGRNFRAPGCTKVTDETKTPFSHADMDTETLLDT